jgi:hypothetical protein
MQKCPKVAETLWVFYYKPTTLQPVARYTKFIKETPKFINARTLRSQQPKKTYFCPLRNGAKIK